MAFRPCHLTPLRPASRRAAMLPVMYPHSANPFPGADQYFDKGWFPVRITEVLADGYLFVATWIKDDGTTEDVPGGHFNAETDLAYSLDGSTLAVGDMALARRAPGIAGGGWELVRSTSSTMCCPTHTPISYSLQCPEDSGSGSGDLGWYFADACGCGSLWPWSQEQLQEIGGYPAIDTILAGNCSWTRNNLDGNYYSMPVGLHFCGTTWGTTTTGGDPNYGWSFRRVMCVGLDVGEGSFSTFGDGLTEITNIEANYNFASSNSGWAFSYYSQDGTFRISGVLRFCPEREGFFFVGTIRTSNADCDENGHRNGRDIEIETGSGECTSPCGCHTQFPACPEETDGVPRQEVTLFSPPGTTIGLRIARLVITTVCGSFRITLGRCTEVYTPCCDVADVLLLTVPDGVNAGSYKVINVGGQLYTVELASEGPISIACEDGVFTMFNKTESVTSSSVACSPLAVVFPSSFGSTGNITLSPWPY